MQEGFPSAYTAASAKFEIENERHPSCTSPAQNGGITNAWLQLLSSTNTFFCNDYFDASVLLTIQLATQTLLLQLDLA